MKEVIVMSLVKHTDKRTGVTYVYESESYWDKEKQQPRSHRRMIWKIDPETGEIVPTNGRGRKKKNPESYKDLLQYDDDSVQNGKDTEDKYLLLMKEKDIQISELQGRIHRLEREKETAVRRLEALLGILKKG